MTVPNYSWNKEKEKEFWEFKNKVNEVTKELSERARQREEQHRQLTYHIKLTKPIPFYEKLEDVIAEYIMKGYIKLGDTTPTEEEQS